MLVEFDGWKGVGYFLHQTADFEEEIRGHSSRDRVLGALRLCGIQADFSPTVRTDCVRVDWLWSNTLSDEVGSGQSRMFSRGRAKGICEYRRPLADPRESLHAGEGLGPESGRLGSMVANTRGGNDLANHLSGQHSLALRILKKLT